MRTTPINPDDAAALVTSERWTSKTTPGPDGCILWTGALLASGYGAIALNGHMARAHRIALVAHLGRDLTPGTEAGHTCHDHARDTTGCPPDTCHHRRCINPHHLAEQVRTTNTRGPANTWTTCKRGHPLEGNLLNRSDGRRECKTCHRDRERQRYQRDQT